MGLFDRFRAPEGCWPWPNIDSPVVRLEAEKAAVHEAGHAVVGRYFGLGVIRLSIRRNGDHTGQVTTVATSPQKRATMVGWAWKIAGKNNPASPNRGPEIGLRPRDHFKHEASLHAELHDMLAGAVAENIQYGPFTSWEGNGWESDLKRFHLLVSAHYGNLDGFISDSFFTSIRDRYWNSCQQILSKPEIWVWHDAVVKAAIGSENGVLTGEEIDSLRTWRPLLPDRPAFALPSVA